MKRNPFATEAEHSHVPTEMAIDSTRLLLREPGEETSDPIRMEMNAALIASDRLEETTLLALDRLSARTGMPITQESAQRRYGPPLDALISFPPRGSEIFVGKLPRNCFEPELVPLFQRAGRIYEMRLMMEFNGMNRGFCFVKYFTPAEADKAVRILNNFQIRKGRKIGVTKSLSNCRLFISGIPENKRHGQILTEISKLVDGVVKVVVYPSQEKHEFSPGFAFVEFKNHKLTALARRKLITGNLQMWGTDIAVDWAEPELEVKVLFVRNLNLRTTEQVIRHEFDAVSSGGVLNVKKIRNIAFIRFKTQRQADDAKLAMENSYIDGSRVQVNYSKSTVQDYASPKNGNQHQTVNLYERNRIQRDFHAANSCSVEQSRHGESGRP